MVDLVAAQHRALPVNLRKKLTKNQMEEKAEVCAAAVAFSDELQAVGSQHCPSLG